MASSYPSSADALSNPASGDALSTGHAAQHANANDAIEAIEGTLGLNPQGASATVKARLDAIEAADWVTSTRILDGTIVNGDISASAAIDPSKVAQNVVTFSNADAVVATSTRKLVQIGTMSASRTVTLPAASGVPAGTELVVADLSGSVTTTNTIVVSRAGSDTVNGATSTTIGAAYGWRRFVSDGSSKWVFDGGVHRTSDTGTVTSTNILDGTIVNADINASAAIDVSKISGAVASATVGNLLTANQASLETDATGWVQGANSTVARSTATALHGSASLAMTCTGAGDASCALSVGAYAPVTPGVVYGGTLATKAATTGRICAVSISWYTAGGAFISATSSPSTLSNTSTWTTIHTAGVAPATAAGARLVLDIAGPSASEVHYVDCAGVWVGAGGQWALPGTPIVNLGTYTDESVGRRIFTYDNVNQRFQQTYGDTGLRNMTSALGGSSHYTINNADLRRVGSMVEFYCDFTTTASWVAGDTLVVLPAGFDLPLSRYGAITFYASSAAAISSGYNVNLYSLATGTTYRVHGTWQVTSAWPTSLPGTASGSIPA